MSSHAKHSLSVSLIARNEAQNIRRCLDSVKSIADEIVVVCNDCTDGTESIAELEYGATVVREKWHGYREQKNISLSRCRCDWVLCLDADEALSPELSGEILALIAANPPDVAAAEFPRLSRFLGRWIRHGDWYPDRCLRLVRRDAGKWSGDKDHCKIVAHGGGKTRRLTADLLHRPYADMPAQVRKIIAQSDDFLDKSRETGATRFRLANVIFRPPWRFFRAYVLRRGFLDGFPGFYIAASNAFAVLLKHARLHEHSRPESHE